ncbi:MAG: M20/M25/M40 family metallo-hydrolase [Bacteroidales bacterium]
MKLLNSVLFVVLALAGQTLTAQVVFDLSEEAVISRMKEDVYALSSEEMEGREGGTEGERKAAAYIMERMREIGLEPLFGDDYYQDFTFSGEWIWGEDNYFSYLDHIFVHGDDYYAFPGAETGEISGSFVHVGYGLTGLEGVDGYENYCDYALHGDIEGKVFVMEVFVPEALDSLMDAAPFQILQQKVSVAKDRGAAGVIFVNTKSSRDDPPLNLRVPADLFDLPLVFAEDHVLHALMSDQSGSIDLEVDVYREELASMNVAGYIDNGAPHTVVVGGHYDHVGWGGSGSRSPGVRAIHYGADDNASGTAGVLEAARYVAGSDLSNHNYLFIAFGAEEKGLIGSRHFAGSDAYDMERVNYMLNLDMIGRLEEETLTLIGTGSSPSWDELIDRYTPEGMTVRKNPDGSGGSDHTSFYVKDIPVLFFFTGIHDDYHRPEDTPEKVNYEGMAKVVSFALDMMAELDQRNDRLAFSSTSSGDATPSRMEGVTLGLMPDHGYGGKGLKVLAVSDDRPAQKAGIENGDVIVQINDMEILEIQTYMEALGRLSEGDIVTVVVNRGDEQHSLEVEL